tara:strand:- start:1310 stop:3757 length:2448 start_codon:yes stop_codon:yes gene_type:complete
MMSESFISEVVRSNQLRMDDDYSYSIDNGKMIISQPQLYGDLNERIVEQGEGATEELKDLAGKAEFIDKPPAFSRQSVRSNIFTFLNNLGINPENSEFVSTLIAGDPSSEFGTADIFGAMGVPEIVEGTREFRGGVKEGDISTMGMGALRTGFGVLETIPGVAVASKALKEPVKNTIGLLANKAREYKANQPPGVKLLSTDPTDPTVDAIIKLDEMVNPKQTMQKGIPFQKEKTDNNLRLHKMRLEKLDTDGTPYPGGPKNERTVIKAPNDNLPDFVVGKITFDDWIARTEKLLSPEEIMAEKDWYDDVFKEFDKVAGDEPDMLRKLGEAWLSAQQNETPSTALTNVLSIFEQFKRGVPFEEVKGKGLPEANKIASSIIYGKEITGGAGQKISDFIDSGYSKPVRSIMGDDAGGGMPFVVDIHTARDTGLVDRKLVNHLTRLGYKVPKNVVLDVGEGGIKGPMYENRAIFGRELTDHLNSIKWQGKDDWRPQEVQAVGWMALSNKLTGEGGRGGNTATAMSRNTSRIAMEVDPGAGSPWADKYGADYGALDEVDRIAINNTVTQRAIEMVAKSEGAVLNTVVHGQGGWKQYTNPSSVMEGLVTFDTAKRVASRLGYLLNQTEVLVNQSKPLTANPENFGLMIVAKGGELSDKNNLDALMEKMLTDDKLGIVTQGYHPITLSDGRAGINIVITKQTLIDAKKEGVIKSQKAGKEYIMDFVNNELSKITDDLNFDAEADILESVAEFVGNDWTKDKTGGNYKINFGGKAGTDAKDPGGSDIDIDGQELEALFSSEITKAKAKKGSGEVTSSVGGDDG